MPCKSPLYIIWVLFLSFITVPVFATGDEVPTFSGTAPKFTLTVVYAREWEYASGARNDGPMLVLSPSAAVGPVGNQAVSLYYTGNLDVLKMYQSILMAAQAMGKPVVLKYGAKWARYKNVLDDHDWSINGTVTGFKLLGVDLAP